MPDESDTNNNNEPPNWLVRIALDTDEMVSVPEVMAKFRYKVRQWARIHAKTKGPVFICFPSPERAPTLLEKYALISAIHDRICTDATSIDPWDGQRESMASAIYNWACTDATPANSCDSPDEPLAEAGEGVDDATKGEPRYSIAYDTLLSDRVPQLWECDSSLVEGWFKHVRDRLGLAKRIPRSEADLEKAAAASNESSVVPPSATDKAHKLESSPRAPAIDDEDLRILRVLHNQKQFLLTICSVSENAHIGNKTVLVKFGWYGRLGRGF